MCLLVSHNDNINSLIVIRKRNKESLGKGLWVDSAGEGNITNSNSSHLGLLEISLFNTTYSSA